MWLPKKRLGSPQLVSSATVMSTAEIIDDGLRDDSIHPIGAGASLLVNGATVQVVYQDQQSADLLTATRNGTWSHSAVGSGAVGFGWWPHLVSTSEGTFLSQFVYDRETAAAGEPFGYVYITTFP